MSDYWDYSKADKKFNDRVKELTSMIGKMDCEKNTIIEVGIWKGTSSIAFSKHFKKVYSLDIVKSAIDNLNSKNIQNIEAILRDDKTCDIFDDESIDVLYIDGDHSKEGVMTDLKELYPKIKKEGYISGHDYEGNNLNVKKAVIEFFGREPDMLVKSKTCKGCSNFIYKK
tara:strand:- start:3957 stop:4466 length:510 start_codon:yes stop_codon:yes gene_type:complete